MRLLTGYISKSLISSNGLNIYYEIVTPYKDNGKTLFLIHGLGGNVSSWDEERIAFRNLGYTTIALDLRGHGLSDRAKVEEDYSMENFSQDVLEIIKKEELSNVILVGHCLGGLIALILEALHPRSAHALTLIDTTYKPATTGKLILDHKLLNKLFLLFSEYAPDIGIKTYAESENFKGTNDINFHRFLSDVIHTSLKSYFLIYKEFLLFDATALLRKILIPTLIIEGTRDSVFPPEVAIHLRARIKTSELEFIKGANHILILNNPKELVRTIHHFLSTLT